MKTRYLPPIETGTATALVEEMCDSIAGYYNKRCTGFCAICNMADPNLQVYTYCIPHHYENRKALGVCEVYVFTVCNKHAPEDISLWYEKTHKCEQWQ